MRTINRRRITFRDNERKTLHDRFGSYNGFFKPKTNLVTVEARDRNTGDTELLTQSTNLIVYHGRSWLMQRAFGFPLGAVGDNSSVYPWDNKEIQAVSDINKDHFDDMYICWFALGQGGCDMSSAPLEPYNTKSVEYQLIDHIPIGGEGEGQYGVNPTGVSDNLRYHHPSDSTGVTRDYHQFDPQYPQFMFDPDIVPTEGGTEDPYYADMEVAGDASSILYAGYKADSYLRALVRVTIAPEECNGPKYYDPLDPGDEFRYINEAGLFVARSHNAGNTVFTSPSAVDEVQMFAKVNFSSIRKDDARELVFSWHLYF